MGLTRIKLSRHNRPTPIQPKKKREQNKENGEKSKQNKKRLIKCRSGQIQSRFLFFFFSSFSPRLCLNRQIRYVCLVRYMQAG